MPRRGRIIIARVIPRVKDHLHPLLPAARGRGDFLSPGLHPGILLFTHSVGYKKIYTFRSGLNVPIIQYSVIPEKSNFGP